MSEENGKVCCNCRHNIRIGKGADMEYYCDIDWHYICYADCMLFWCRRWSNAVPMLAKWFRVVSSSLEYLVLRSYCKAKKTAYLCGNHVLFSYFE